MKIKKTVIVGRGAIGLLYGTQLATVYGAENVKFVMDDARFEQKGTQAITVNGAPFELETLKTSQVANYAPDLVIVAIKTTGMDLTLQMLREFVTPETLLVSFCNGITSERRMAEVFGWEHIPLCIVQGMDATFIGNDMTYGKQGDMLIGNAAGTAPGVVDAIMEYFDATDIPHAKYDDIERRQWCKWMLNVGINQTCMAYAGTYGSATEFATEQNRTYVGAMREAMACAQAEGVAVTEDDLRGMVNLTRTLTPTLMPSMAQDRVNKKKTEVEEFAGTVIALGKKHSIYCPINTWLYDEIKKIEASF